MPRQPNDHVRRNLSTLRQLAVDQGVPAAVLEATETVHAGLLYLKETHDEERAKWWMRELFDRAEFVDEPDIIAKARSPEDWSERLTAKGAPISADEIRKRAQAQGMFYKVGGEMLLMPDHLNQIFLVDNRPEAQAARAAAKDAPPSKDYLRVLARLTKPKKATTKAAPVKRPKRGRSTAENSTD